MEIKRTILGAKIGTLEGEITIKLTDEEVESIYRERRLYYNIEDILSKLDEMLTEYEDRPDEYQTDFGITVGELRAKLEDDEWLKKTAEQFDKALDRNDGFMEYFWETAKSVIERRLED